MRLISEAGGKCANPGCSNWRSHIHHIKHWAIYKAHDAEHMIAVCPSCHDEIHGKGLGVSDDALYACKKIERDLESDHRGHLYIEPSSDIKLLTGTIALATTNTGLIVFRLSNNNALSFKIMDGDIMLVRSSIRTLEGQEVLRVSNNHIRVKRDTAILFERRAGKVRISAPASARYIPPDVRSKMRAEDETYSRDDRVVLLGLEVVRAGTVRVEGLWTSSEGTVIITERSLSILGSRMPRALSLIGDGESSLIKFTGPVSMALFKIK